MRQYGVCPTTSLDLHLRQVHRVSRCTRCELRLTRCELKKTRYELKKTRYELKKTRCELRETRCELRETRCARASKNSSAPFAALHRKLLTSW